MSEIKVEKLTAKDLFEVVALLDAVFTEENGKQMNFAKKFPRVFKPLDENMGWYYGIKENGELVGTAAMHPFPYRVGETVVNVAQVGNVAVSSKCRGRGFMQTLLNKICADMESGDYDIAYLHGERKRYRTFSFERCGLEYVFTMTPSLPRALKLADEFTFTDMRIASPTEVASVIAIAKNRVHDFVRRDDEYIESFMTHESTPLIVRNKDGKTVGYLCYSSLTNMVIELGLEEPSELPGVVTSLLNHLNLQSFQITFAEYESELIGAAMTICRRYEIIQSGNFRILNFPKVVKTFMKAKEAYAGLLPGSLVVDTELFGKWRISYFDGECSVESTDADSDVYLDGYKVYPFMFGPTSPFAAGVCLSSVSPEKKRLVGSWFPLPLYCENLS